MAYNTIWFKILTSPWRPSLVIWLVCPTGTRLYMTYN